MVTTKTAPAPETIRSTAAEILNGPDFRIEQDTKYGETYVELLVKLFEWLIAPFRWLFNAMEGLPEALRWIIVIGLFMLLVLLVVHIIYTLATAIRPSRRKPNFAAVSSSTRKISAEEFEQLAQTAIAQLDYISAVRHLFRASLVHLQSLEGRRLSPGLTNRQYVWRYRKSCFVQSLQYFADVIDASWYGNHLCREQEYQKCAQAYAEIRQQTKASLHADRA